jgi:hypothetical protein
VVSPAASGSVSSPLPDAIVVVAETAPLSA